MPDQLEQKIRELFYNHVGDRLPHWLKGEIISAIATEVKKEIERAKNHTAILIYRDENRDNEKRINDCKTTLENLDK